jgi:hypothetical protein
MSAQITEELRVLVEAEVEKAVRNLEQFDKAVNDAEKSTEGFSESFARQAKEALSVEKALAQMTASVTGAMAVYKLAAKAVQAFTGFVKDSVAAFGEYESLEASLSVALGGAKAAEAAFRELREAAAGTPFSVSQYAEAAVQLKQTGTAASELIDVLTMLGNTAGGSGEKFSRIVANYAQVQAVGKASAMDLRQFAQAGIPILDTLEKTGAGGEASAEQVAEAFRLMTREGGVFYNAMSAGAETLAGKTAALDGAMKTYKATWAETSGLGEFWKKATDARTEAVNKETEALRRNAEARKAAALLEGGDLSFNERAENSATALEERIRLQEEGLGNYLLEIGYSEETLRLNIAHTEETARLERERGGAEDRHIRYMLDVQQGHLKTIEGYREQIALLEKQKAPHDAILEREKQRTDEIEKQNQLLASQKEAYGAARANLMAAYEGTPQGMLDKMTEYRDRILADYEKIKKEGETVPIPAYYDRNGNRVSSYTRPASPEELRKAEIGIEDANKNIARQEESIKKAGGKEKEPLADWQAALKQATGLGDDYLGSGTAAVAEYAGRIREARERLSAEHEGRTVAEMLGLSDLDLAEEKVRKWEDLVRAMTDARIEEPWTPDDLSYRTALDNLTEAQGELAEAKKKSDAAFVTDTLKEYGRKVGELGLSQEELARKTLGAKGATREELEVFDEFAKQLGAPPPGDFQAMLAYWVQEGLDGLDAFDKKANEVFASLAGQLAGVSFDAMLTGFEEIGRAMARNADAETAFGDAIAAMGQQLLSALPSLFLQAGLQMVATPGMWPIGLGLIAAAGASSLINGFVQEKTKGGQEAEANARGNVFSGAATVPYAAGGAFTNRIVDSPTFFRYGASLGVMGEAGPEAVIPLRRMPGGNLGVEAGGGARVTVNITNNSGGEAEVRESEDGNGNKQIDVVIGGMINRHLSSGKADRAVTGRYDVRVRGV